MIVGLGDTLAAEGVGGDDIRPCIEVFAMYFRDDIRAGEVEFVGITDLTHHSAHHSAHSTIQHEDLFFYYLFYLSH